MMEIGLLGGGLLLNKVSLTSCVGVSEPCTRG